MWVSRRRFVANIELTILVECCLSSRPLSVSSDAQRCKSYLMLQFGSFFGKEKNKHFAACWHFVRHATHSVFRGSYGIAGLERFRNLHSLLRLPHLLLQQHYTQQL